MKKIDIKEKRRSIFKDAPKKTLIRKGDKRISSPTRVCGICGEPLSGMKYSNGQVFAKKNHYHIKYSSLLYIDICQDINTCYKNLGLVWYYGC